MDTRALHTAMRWRYATKVFDERPLSEEVVGALMDVVRMAPTSLGMQVFSAYVVRDAQRRAALAQACLRAQRQCATAPVVFAFAVPVALSPRDVDAYIERACAVRDWHGEEAAAFAAKVRGYMDAKTPEEVAPWLDKQVYLVAGHLLLAAAALGVDACPMEGFDPGAVSAVLGCPRRGLRPVLLVPVGYRSPDDAYARAAKVRKAPSELFVFDGDL